MEPILQCPQLRAHLQYQRPDDPPDNHRERRFQSATFRQAASTRGGPGHAPVSLDGYSDSGVNASGQKTETHYTFKFFVGQPDYDTVRQRFLDVATGKIQPISSRDNLPVP